MKIGDVYIHTITNTRLRVEEIREKWEGYFVAYLKPEDPRNKSMYGYLNDNGRYPFPVEYIEKQAAEEDGSFKRV